MSTVRSRIGLSIALAAALTAGACGGKSKTDSATDSTSGDPTAGVTDITTAAGDPVDGGKIIYGLEAETSGFNPVADRWAISAYLVASAVYDPLFAFDDEGNWQPYLAESMVPNEDNTVWVLTLRSDVVFHDGTTLNAEDVAYMYNKPREAPLNKPVLADVESV